MIVFKKILRLTYYYSDRYDEIGDYMQKEILTLLGDNFDVKNFVCAAWVRGMIADGRILVVVMKEFVVARNANGSVSHNYFSDMTGIETFLKDNIKLLSPGNFTLLFHQLNRPSKHLVSQMFPILQKLWQESRQNHEATKPADLDIPDQIRKLAELKDQGILTDDEFQNKKNDLLSRM